MADHENYSASNRKLWDEWADVHASGTWYDLDAVRRGSDKLRPYEIDEVGDVRDRTLIHLMCQLGTDTLAWARRGADATGVDFSARAIAHARKLAADGGVDAKFICCDVLNIDTELHSRWDIVYTSRGVLGWIADMAKWADMVSRLLKPGGLVYLTDIHPIAKVLDDQSSDVRVARPYFPRPKPIAYPVKGSYADPGAAVTSTVKYLWTHSMGEIVTCLANAGLAIELLHEFPWLDRPWPSLHPLGTRTWILPQDMAGELPLFFSLRARKT